MTIPREEHARVAINDLLASVPTLEAILELRSKVVLDGHDEFRINFIFDLVTTQATVLLGMLEIIEGEVNALYAIREGYSQQDHALDSDDT